MEGIAIMTSGGDAAGMNPAVKCAVEYSTKKGFKPYLVRNGLRGLIDDKISEATREDVSGILHRGGTILRSSRSARFFDAGIPATIDNDIPGTDYCLGVDTALNVIRESVDSIRDTATSFNRAFVIETMGRHCGYLAITSALSSGAEICIAPEIEYDLDSIGARLKKDCENGREYIIAIAAEGTNMAEYLTRWIQMNLDMDARLTVLGHVQRGGSPTVRDRIMAYKFAVAAVDSLLEGNTNQIMVYKEGNFGSMPIHEVADAKYKMDASLIKLAEHLGK